MKGNQPGESRAFRMASILKGLRTKVDTLLSSLVPLYQIEEDGSISTGDMSVELYEGALIQLLDVAESKLTAIDFEHCARRALTETIRSKCTRHTEFESNLNREIEKFKNKEFSQFQICSRCHFSAPHDFHIEVELWGAKLKITQAAPDGLSAAQPELSNGQKALSTPEFGAYLTMTVHERTRSGALERASREISLLLGVLNFSLNLGKLTFFFFGNERTLAATIFPGREIFIIDENGITDKEVFRYYTTHPKQSKNITPGEIDKLKNHVNIIERLKNIPKNDRDFYRSFFELYFDALSELDGDAIVMRLWKAAEHLTMAQSAQQIANRLALTWSDKEAVSAVCYALGQRRNWAMHNPKPSPRVENLPEHFRHFLEYLAWKSLSTDVKNVAHWRTIMQMSDMDIDFDLAADTIGILRALR
jgi:hypothetical protein